MERSRPLTLLLLDAGIPPTLLMDLLDPDGLRAALATELAELDVLRDAATTTAQLVRSA